MAFKILEYMLVQVLCFKTALCEQGGPPIYRLRPFVRYSTSENEDLERYHIAGTLSSAI